MRDDSPLQKFVVLFAESWGRSAAASKVGNARKKRAPRPLRFESLENRELLAADAFADFASFAPSSETAETVEAACVAPDLAPVVVDASAEPLDLSTVAAESESESLAVVAAESAPEIEIASNAKTWTVSTTSDSDSLSTTLRYAINNASSGDKIVFASSMNGKTITLSGKELYAYSKALTIDASALSDGITIDGGGLSRCLELRNVSSGSITINNVSFTGGKGSSGSAIYLYRCDDATFNNCVFYGNSAGSSSGSGSAIYADGSTTMNDCSVVNNVAGRAISADGNSLTLNRTSVSNNSGIGVFTLANLNANDCVFSSNGGRGLYAHGATAFPTNCEFEKNLGGGIEQYQGSLTATDCSFVSNVASSGGAITSNGETILIGCEFVGNKTNANGGDGGAIASNGALTIENSTFSGNVAKYCGGAIYQIGGSAAASGCAFNANVAQYGGGIYFHGSTSKIVDSDFTGNRAEGATRSSGGAIYSDGANLTIGVSSKASCSISDNTALYDGGAINMADGNLTVEYAKISGNYARNAGGGCWLSGSSATFRNVLIVENNVSIASSNSGCGGGIYQRAYETTLIDCTIAKNGAYYGGGIYASGNVTTAFNTIIAQNTAKSSVSSNNADVDRYNSSVSVRGCNNLSSFTNWSTSDFDSKNNVAYSSGTLFTNAAGGDYTLASGAKAIDRGSNEYATDVYGQILKKDLSGKSRVYNDVVDIGAYEYRGGSTQTALTRLGTSTSRPQVGTQITTTLYAGSKTVASANATYRWYRVDSAGTATQISGATSSSYTPTSADVGYKLRVEATAKAGTAYSGTVRTTHSNPTTAAATALTRIGTSTSRPKVGTKITTTLYAGSQTVASANATYRWYRISSSGNVVAISGATSSSYTPTSADVGYYLRVEATAKTGTAYSGAVEATHSKPTIAAATTALTKIGTSTSQPQVGVRIRTTLYTATGAKSGATATYQWYRVNSAGRATAISGATSSSYTPTTADIGYKLRVIAVGTGSYSGTVSATHSRPTIAKSSAVLDDAFAAFDWDDAFVEF